jgi:hypothetical protein
MTKKERILALLEEGKTPQEIAAIVGCLDAYVRTVRQRVKHGGQTPADKVNIQRQYERRKTDPEVRRRQSVYSKEYQKRRYQEDHEYREMMRAKSRGYYDAAKDDPDRLEKRRAYFRKRYQTRKAEINAKRKVWLENRRAIVAAMIEVAYAKT